VQIEIYGLGMDYAEKYPTLIGSVTKDDVLAAAKKYLHPDSVLLVAVADQNEAKIKSANLEKPAAGAGGQ
jgi:zinc protease